MKVDTGKRMSPRPRTCRLPTQALAILLILLLCVIGDSLIILPTAAAADLGTPGNREYAILSSVIHFKVRHILTTVHSVV
jgi:hypothetical protein